MLFESQFERAAKRLLALQNPDGGIPATLGDQDSGCWTSADTLEAIVTALPMRNVGLSQIEGLVDFLLSSQLVSDDVQSLANGGWALFKGEQPCTMATGHAVAALAASHQIFDGSQRGKLITEAIKHGVNWLQTTQNEDGSWGAFPSAGRGGRSAKIVAIHYALLAYYYLDETPQSSRSVRLSCEFLGHAQKSDGSWSNDSALSGNVSDTCRAAIALIRTGYVESNNNLIKKSISFVFQKRSSKYGLWEIETENIHIQDAPAQLVVNRNTLCDVLTFLSLAAPEKEAFNLTLTWLLNSQRDDGTWVLSSPAKVVSDVETWSTAEWITAINIAATSLPPRVYQDKYVHWGKIKTWIKISSAIFVLLIVIATPIFEMLLNMWSSFPAWVQQILIGSVIIGMLVNIFSTFIYDKLRKWKER